MQEQQQGHLFIVSGPSGTGKGTLIKYVLAQMPNTWLSVSRTTRNPRENDVEGVTYHFISEDEFTSLIEREAFLEWANYSGSYYGTLREPVEEKLAAGFHVFLEIEVQGALQVIEKRPDATMIFIEPPSFEELERRLRGRGTDSEASVLRRLETAKTELAEKWRYEYCLMNDVQEQAEVELLDYINSVIANS